LMNMNAHRAREYADLSALFRMSCKLRMTLCVFSIGRDLCIARVSAFGIQASRSPYPKAATHRAYTHVRGGANACNDDGNRRATRSAFPRSGHEEMT
jgi:hypothetical protein